MSEVKRYGFIGDDWFDEIEDGKYVLASDYDALAAKLAAYEEAHADTQQLCREIDEILCGKDGMARQASLCDLVNPIKDLKAKLALANTDQLQAEAELNDTKAKLAQAEDSKLWLEAHYKAKEAQVTKLMSDLSQAERERDELKALRIKYGPICLVCGAAEPCELKDDPNSPCTFDPAPRQLWDRCQQLERDLAAAKERYEKETQSLVDKLDYLSSHDAIEIAGLQTENQQMRAAIVELAESVLVLHDPTISQIHHHRAALLKRQWGG